MLIRNHEANVVLNVPTYEVKEYKLPTKFLGLATAKINGRFPEKGRVLTKTVTRCIS
jgi:hypothetical protein